MRFFSGEVSTIFLQAADHAGAAAIHAREARFDGEGQ